MKYLVFWIIYNTVTTPCPNANPNSDRECAVLHLKTTMVFRDSFFNSRQPAINFYDSLIKVQKTASDSQFLLFYNNRVQSVSIDSVNLNEK